MARNTSTRKATIKRYSSVPPAATKGRAAVAVDALSGAIDGVKAVGEPMTATTTAPQIATVAATASETVAPAVAVEVAAPAATESIQHIPSQEVVALLETLRSSCADSARDAAVSLGQAADRSAVEPLINVVANVNGFFHDVVRAAAIASLGQLGDTRALNVLQATVSDSMAEASAEAVRALAQIGDVRTLPTLLSVVRNENGYFLPIVRRAAVLALPSMNHADAKAQLEVVAGNEHEDPVIRDAARQALA